MNDRTWKNISITLGVICALLIGVAGALLVVGGKSGSPTTSSSPDSSLVSVASQAPDATPTGTVIPGQSQTASVVPVVSASATPASGPGDPATITFTNLGLDASKDTNGFSRTFTFVSDGPGPVTFAVTKISKGGTAKMCIKVDAGDFACKVGTLVSFLQSKADPGHNTWTMALQGYSTSAPAVDVTMTWPSVNPKVTVNHGRLQGSSTSGVSEALNGLAFTFKPRKAGTVNVQAVWTTITADVSMTLWDVTSAPSLTIDTRTYPQAASVTPTYSFKVDQTKSYQGRLRDSSPDNGRPDLTAEITFP